MSKNVTFSSEDLGRRIAQQISVPLTVDIYEWYQEMLRSHTVLFDPTRASWLVFGYQEVQRVLLDQETFSSQRQVNADGKVDPLLSASILSMDPPRHRQLRALISQAFTPRMVAQLEPRITAIVQDLLDQVAARGEMDLVGELAFPLPILVIAELLGVPSNDRELFRAWSAEVVSPDRAQQKAAFQNIMNYIHKLIILRRQEPREDLVSALLQAEVDGQGLSEEEILANSALLLVAGHETTTGLISNAVVCLDEHPESLQELLAHPELLPSAIEEILRYRGVTHLISRIAMVDTVLAGHQIKAGDLVLPVFAAANLDERQFPQAATFDIRRTPNRHLGFGQGIHFCLGAPLARLEVRIALGMLLERFPTMRRRRSMPLELRPSYFIYGLKHVPVEW